MLDALSAPPTPAPGAIVSQSGPGTRADQAQDDSFSKVLSNSGNQEKSGRQSEDDQVGQAHDGDAGKHAVDERPKRPVIDISANSVTSAEETLSDIGDLSTDELARLLAAARSKAKNPSEDGPKSANDDHPEHAVSKAELAKALAGAREKKPVTEGETATEASAEQITASDAKSPDLADVLRLLAGAPRDEAKADDVAGEADDTAKLPGEPKNQAALLEAVSAGMGTSADDAANGQDQDADPERTFRVVRGDGKGQPVGLQNEQTGRLDDSADSTPVETITVVEARRFIAPASSTNGAAITAAMLGDSEWINAMSPGSELANAAAQSGHGKVVNTLKLQMTPIELGSVTATLRLTGEELSVQLTVDNPAALRQLSNDTSDILKALRAQGLTVDHVQVNMQVSSVDRSADAGQNSAAGQQPGQQTFQPGGQGSDGRARGENTSSTRVADERVVQHTEIQSPDARGTRPGQLYL